jgi:triosephosphate isomerase
MYVDTRGSVALAREVLRMTRGKEKLPEVVLCPSFLAIPDVQKVLGKSRIHLGAQDVFWESEGPHTGEVGARALHDAGCRFVVVGHSERRRELGETDDMVGRKVDAAFAAGLLPLVCVGETQEAHEEGKTIPVLEAEIQRTLKNAGGARVGVVYEPLWAISSFGKGEPEDVSRLREVFGALRGLVGKEDLLLYGGSVNAENAYTYLREDLIDGVLVGYASVKPHELAEMISAAAKAAHL